MGTSLKDAMAIAYILCSHVGRSLFIVGGGMVAQSAMRVQTV